MTKLKIKVTKEILERSKFCGMTPGPISSNCAIALAVREIFPHAHVTEYKIEVWSAPYPGKDARALGNLDLPMEALLFIRIFDEYTPEQRVGMDELEFEVEIPDDILNHINIDEIREILKTSTVLELKEV